MSDNNEAKAESNEAKSKPAAKKRGATRSRKPTKSADSDAHESGIKKTSSSANTKDPDTNAQAKGKQSARRPSKKKPESEQSRPDRIQGDGKSGELPDDGIQKPSKDTKSTDREQSARRPAKRKSDSNRRRSGSSSRSSSRGGRPSNRSRPTLRQPFLNPEELQAKAWELYRADISEESTAMFNEDEAVDLVRRSFILADIFLRFRDQLFDTGPATQKQQPSETSENTAED